VKMFMCILALVTVGDWWKKFLSTCLPAWLHRFQLYRLRLSLSSTNRLIWQARWATEFSSLSPQSSSSKGNGNGNGRRTTGDREKDRTLINRRERYHQDARSSIWGEALKQEFTVRLPPSLLSLL
jgi:hypothetical protein